MTVTGIDTATQVADNGSMPRNRTSQNVVLRIEPSMLERWRLAAKADDRDVSSLVRKAVNTYIAEHGLLPPDPSPE